MVTARPLKRGATHFKPKLNFLFFLLANRADYYNKINLYFWSHIFNNYQNIFLFQMIGEITTFNLIYQVQCVQTSVSGAQIWSNSAKVEMVKQFVREAKKHLVALFITIFNPFCGILFFRQLLTIFLLFSVDISSPKNISKKWKTWTKQALDSKSILMSKNDQISVPDTDVWTHCTNFVFCCRQNFVKF